MSNVRPRYIKSVCSEIITKYPDRVTNDFELNKLLVDDISDINSKVMRNRIAGYLVKLHNKSNRIIIPPSRSKKEKGPRKKRKTDDSSR